MTPLRALLVEDSKHDAELVQLELGRNGYALDLEHVDSAEALTDALERRSWDVIICDYNLPGFGGDEALEIVNEHDVDAPFIILSGSIGEEAVVEALKAGARDCVLKTNLARLVPVLERALTDAETHRRRIESDKRLRASEERLRLALEAGQTVMWDHDLRTGEIVASGYRFDVPGLREDDISTFDDFVAAMHPDDRDRVVNAIGGLAEGVLEEELEFRLVGQDGTVRWVASRASIIMDEAGEPSHMVGLAPDITARKQAEVELRASNDLLSALLDSSPLAIAATDLDRRLTIWNAAAERMFGWRAEEVLGKVSPVIPAEELERLEGFFERLWNGDVIVDAETTRIHRDGTRLDTSLSLAPLIDAEGIVYGTVGVLSDIGERKAAQAELQQSLELLRTANDDRRRLLERLVRAQEEERQRIAADIHDDSVQALTALALRLGIAAGQTADPETAETFRDAERTTQRAIDRLRRLMFELRPPALDRDGLVEALRIYLEQMKSDHDLEYTLDVSFASEPRAESRATLYRIAQEAIVNVTKHARASRLSVRAEERSGGVWVRIDDDGTGFSPQEARKVGHVGLDSMRERAELAGGWWKVDSTAGAGSTVEFFLPTPTDSA